MKSVILLFALFFPALAFCQNATYETYCKDNECLKNGWVTTSFDYRMDVTCKEEDCAQFGWTSVTNNWSTSEVTCLEGGCFVTGWRLEQKSHGPIYSENVSCRNSSCLTEGWAVTPIYGVGANVTCWKNDCGKYGLNYFRNGLRAHVLCRNEDCFHEGWTLFSH